MKTKLIIATATVAGALLLTWFLKKREAGYLVAAPVPLKNSHHLIDVFAQAKKHID